MRLPRHASRPVVPASAGAGCAYAPGRRRRTRWQAGYSLLEIIGVLAIIAILAAAVTENALNRIKMEARTTESALQERMDAALKQSILRHQQIPAATNLPSTIAAEMGMSVNRATYTPWGNRRWFLVDPGFRVGTNSIVSANVLPYLQTPAGSLQPLSARMMIISSLAEALPSGPAPTNYFDVIWNTPMDQVPSYWPYSPWKKLARGSDIRIQRIELGALFARAVLNNADLTGVAPYSVEATTPLQSVAATNRFETYYLRQTAINLHYGTGGVQGREFIQEDTSYVYERGRWGRDVMHGRSTYCGFFCQLVEQFLAQPAPPAPKFGATQQSVAEEMFNYMWNYGLWANEGFPVGGSSSAQQVPVYRVLNDCQARFDKFSYNLVN